MAPQAKFLLEKGYFQCWFSPWNLHHLVLETRDCASRAPCSKQLTADFIYITQCSKRYGLPGMQTAWLTLCKGIWKQWWKQNKEIVKSNINYCDVLLKCSVNSILMSCIKNSNTTSVWWLHSEVFSQWSQRVISLLCHYMDKFSLSSFFTKTDRQIFLGQWKTRALSPEANEESH